MTKKQSALDKRKHHFMSTGQIVFNVKDDKGNDITNVMMMNALTLSDTTNIDRAMLGRIQHALQVNFLEKMKAHQPSVIDCVIMNIQNLGFMTQTEFFRVPEGTPNKPIQKTELAAAATSSVNEMLSKNQEEKAAS